jgi:MFS family permease
VTVVMTLAGRLRTPFARYWLSGFLADFGDGVRLAAFPLLAAEFTRSPSMVAAVTAVQGLPWLVLGAGLGVLVDRTDRRRLMVMVDVARAMVIAGLAAAILTHSAGLVLIYLTAFTTGAGSALRDTAAMTCVPRLVDPGDLDRANARVIVGQVVGNELAGPAAGGWLFGLAAVLPFAVNAGMLGIAVLLLVTLPSVFRPVSQPGREARATSLAALRQEFADGLRWLWRHPAIRDVTIAVGVIVAIDGAWFAVLVLYVIQDLQQRPGVYGLLLAISAVGGIAVGGLGPPISRRLGPWRSLLIAGLAMAASQAVLGLTANVIIAAVMLAASSAACVLFDMTAITMRHRQVPDNLLGRISGLYRSVLRSSEALGALGGGLVAAAAGIRATMLIGAVPIAATVSLLTWHHRPARAGRSGRGAPRAGPAGRPRQPGRRGPAARAGRRRAGR